MSSNLHVTFLSLYNLDAVGLRYMSSVLKQEGHTVDIIFFKEPTHINPVKQYRIVPAITRMEKPKDKEIDKLVEIVGRLNTDIIGVSLNCSSLFRIAARISQALSSLSVPVMWGGVHPTLQPEQCTPYADIICRGEGEKPVLALVNALAAGEKMTHIPNLWVKKDRLYKNDTQPPVQDLNSLPFPDHAPDYKHYITVFNPHAAENNYALVTARGCPFSCSYCCNHALHTINRGNPVRQRSVKNVIAELTTAKKKGYMKTVRIFDDIFGLNKKWMEEFAQQYKEHIDLPLGFNIHPNTAKKEVLKPLQSLAFVDVTMGIQSGSPHVRENIYNRITPDEAIVRASNILHEMGFFCAYDMITDNPYEHEDDLQKTIDLLLKIPRPFMLSMTSLAFFPCTELTERALRDRIITESMVEGESDKVTHEWLLSTEYPRDKEHQYYNLLMVATQYDTIPKWVIRVLKTREKKSLLLVHTLLRAAITLTKMRRRSLYKEMENTLQSKMGGE